ncbi:MAG TPA: aldehyde ferredoxin oxidoreductase family protein [Anaerolineales bacterium]|nr:aldehyde ferredoxin oxidoreductase family protein [Anaerolineales bacterium]
MLQPILKVDLTTRTIREGPVPRDWVRDYFGAASLAARMLYEHLTLDLDPLSPEAPLLFLNGPLTGTAGPAVGRFVICAKSPATGLWGEANIGGFWGPELRRAGFDGLWITGAAEAPVYLWIRDGRAGLHPADHLWGATTYGAQSVIQQELGETGTRVASIGPAGENRVPFALILCDHGRVAGRTGMGAVMGSKNLKAVAVKGSGEVPLVDWAAYKPARSAANRALRDHNQSVVLRDLGTASGAEYFDYLGELPKKYFQSGVMGPGYHASGCTVSETILVGVSACHGCVIACGRVVDLGDGRGRRKGAEYETMAGFGPNLMIEDIAAVTRLGERCDELGLDSISASNVIGLAFKFYEEGRITPADTGGLPLKWGDPEAAAACVEAAAVRKGFGRFLALGARGFGRYFGAEEAAVQVNGLEAAYHDPRGASGMALSYATSPRGACHNQSDFFFVDVLGQTVDGLGLTFHSRHAGAEKARDVAIHQNWRSVNNALVLCILAEVPPDSILRLLNAALGIDETLPGLLLAGERAWNIKRVINHRLGLTGMNDRLPQAFLEPMPDGGSAGFTPDFTGMLSAYYQARGWDPTNGRPAPEKLASLGLEWALPDP